MEKVRVSECVRIMITVTKVFSSYGNVFSGFTLVENMQLGVCIREHFDMFEKALGLSNLKLVQFLKCLLFVFSLMLLA